MVGGEGSIFEGRSWYTRGAFYKPLNGQAYGIGFVGNFLSATGKKYGSFFNILINWKCVVVDFPSNAAISAVKNFLNCAVKAEFLDKNYTMHFLHNINPLIENLLT